MRRPVPPDYGGRKPNLLFGSRKSQAFPCFPQAGLLLNRGGSLLRRLPGLRTVIPDGRIQITLSSHPRQLVILLLSTVNLKRALHVISVFFVWLDPVVIKLREDLCDAFRKLQYDREPRGEICAVPVQLRVRKDLTGDVEVRGISEMLQNFQRIGNISSRIGAKIGYIPAGVQNEIASRLIGADSNRLRWHCQAESR